MDIKELEDQISKAQEAYYNGQSIISDDEYDALVYQLASIDPKHNLLKKVGSNPAVSEWTKVKHKVPLGSLNKINFPEEMSDWFKSTSKNQPVVVQEKLDGLSLGLQYEAGKLVHAVLRGGGLDGEDILQNVLKMGVPKYLPTKFNGTIRGEIVLTKTNHKKYFAEYSNPRNAASGICRRYDGVGSEHLTLICYQIMGDIELETERNQLNQLQAWGFKIPNFSLCNSADDVNALWNSYQKTTRESLDYEIDGLVIGINDLVTQESLGETNMRPKGKIAFKFANQFIKTKVLKITWQVGNSGRVTPVCWFTPVSLLGSTIEKASIYNVAYIEKIKLDVGADVLVCKSNEIIPRVESVVTSTNTIVKPPTHCPCCNYELVVVGENLICQNTSVCSAQIVGRIKNWVSELNLLEVGDKLIEKLVELNIITDIAGLYTLDVKQLSKLERLGVKSATNIVNSINSNLEIGLETLIGGLSIPLIGTSTMKVVVEAGYDSLDKLFAAKPTDLEKIPGLGPARSLSLVKGLLSNKELIQKLVNHIKIKGKVQGVFTGASFAITGTLSRKRAEVEQMIVNAGGIVKSSVGKGLTYLIINDINSTSSKAVTAKKLGTKLLTEDDFFNLLK